MVAVVVAVVVAVGVAVGVVVAVAVGVAVGVVVGVVVAVGVITKQRPWPVALYKSSGLCVAWSNRARLTGCWIGTDSKMMIRNHPHRKESPMTDHLSTLRATKPDCPNSNVSTPVGEACQWAAKRIEELEALLTIERLLRKGASDSRL